MVSALEYGRRDFRMSWADDATDLWVDAYEALIEDRGGMFGAVTARAEAQTLRLSMIYALADLSPEIRHEHVESALAVWQYAEESARYIFGDATGDPVADQILEALRAAGPAGMSRTDISHLFKRHRSAERIGQALSLLLKSGRAHRKQDNDTGGRPSERWFGK
jgi:DNA replicative helicase MCM subunit Mcm2 (Cdc46/Mcm family)